MIRYYNFDGNEVIDDNASYQISDKLNNYDVGTLYKVSEDSMKKVTGFGETQNQSDREVDYRYGIVLEIKNSKVLITTGYASKIINEEDVFNITKDKEFISKFSGELVIMPVKNKL